MVGLPLQAGPLISYLGRKIAMSNHPVFVQSMCTSLVISGDGMPRSAPKGPAVLIEEDGLQLALDKPSHKYRPSEAVACHRAALLEIIHRHGAANPRIFGSVARGEDDLESDLDLLVDRLPGTGLIKLAMLQLEAETLLGLPVDVHTPEGLKNEVRAQVMREARQL